MTVRAQEMVEAIKKHWTGPMTEKEIAFLQDVQGLVEFSIRNGLSFPMVVSVLCHDVNEIARNGFDYEKTVAQGFAPQVTGYSKLNNDSFGENGEEVVGH